MTNAIAVTPTPVNSTQGPYRRQQLAVLLALLIVYAICVFISYTFLLDQMLAYLRMPAAQPAPQFSPFVLGLMNGAIVVIVYGLAGLIGYWAARKLGLPGIFNPSGTWRRWLGIPFILGVGSGLALVIGDLMFAQINGFGRFVHPPFPSSIFTSLSAGIGEELMFRGMVFGLLALVFNWALKRWHGYKAALWVANILAAFLFGFAHLGSLMAITGVSSPAELNPVLWVEMFLLNGMIGVLAGDRYMKDGLVAACGVHFWCDVVFHVVWGLL